MRVKNANINRKYQPSDISVDNYDSTYLFSIPIDDKRSHAVVFIGHVSSHVYTQEPSGCSTVEAPPHYFCSRQKTTFFLSWFCR